MTAKICVQHSHGHYDYSLDDIHDFILVGDEVDADDDDDDVKQNVSLARAR